jgi:hypothetical protein
MVLILKVIIIYILINIKNNNTAKLFQSFFLKLFNFIFLKLHNKLSIV